MQQGPDCKYYGQGISQSEAQSLMSELGIQLSISQTAYSQARETLEHRT